MRPTTTGTPRTRTADNVNDTLILDFITSSNLAAGGITFHGGGGTGVDGAVIQGGIFTTIVQKLTNATDGQTLLQSGNGQPEVTFNWFGLEPFLINSGSTVDLIFELPVGITDAVLEDADPLDANAELAGKLQLRSPSGAFETTIFSSPTNSIRIRGGLGADSITIGDLDPSFTGTIVVDGSALGSDLTTVTYTGWTQLAGEVLGGKHYQVLSRAAGDATVTLKVQDELAPSLVITPNGSLTPDEGVLFTFQFTETVSGFDFSDVVLNNGIASELVKVDGDTYTMTVTTVADGTLSVSVQAGAASDLALNASAAAAGSLTVDRTGPSFTTGTDFNVHENTTSITTIDATDLHGPVTYVIVNEYHDFELFTLNSNGELRFTQPKDFENITDADHDNVYRVAVWATDALHNSTMQEIRVRVTDANEFVVSAVVDADSATADQVLENLPVGTYVGVTVEATDQDGSNNQVTYSLQSNPTGLLTIDSTTGRVTTAAAIDREAIQTIAITVVATSADQSTSAKAFTINVLGENDNAPRFETPDGIGVDEGTSFVHQILASDADLPAQAITFRISGGIDAGRFQITSDGLLSFLVAPDYETPSDANTDNLYLVEIEASDSQRVTKVLFRVVASPVNESSPTISSTATVSAAENQTQVVTVTANDADLPAESLSYSLSGGADEASFSISSTGVLTFVSPPDFESPADADRDNVYLVTVAVSDGERVTEQTISVTVTDVTEYDFGDAPASYGTTLASNGARHLAVGPQLGAARDTEADGPASVTANGDGNDEDGVVLPATLYSRLGAKISVTASAAGRLDAWIDFNRNGVFDSSERIANGLNMAAGANSFTIDLPTTIVAGPTFARFRLSTSGGLEPTGAAANGEVEDYPLTLAIPALGSVQVVSDPENPSQGLLLVRGTNAAYEMISVQPTAGPVGKVTATISPGATFAGIDLTTFDRIAIFGEAGIDSISIGSAITKPSVIYGDAGFDNINGGGGADTIYGGADYDTLNGNGGDDTFVNEGGGDGINGGAGSDTVVKRGSGTFTLSNYSLSAGGDYLSISSIENATLVGGSGPDIFNVTGWTGGVVIQGGGGTNTLTDSADANFVVLPNLLKRTVGSLVTNIQFSEIDIVNLTGGFGNNTFDLSAWPTQAVLSGGYYGTDTVIVAGNVDYMLTDVLLQRPNMGLIRLSSFENAVITGGATANTFNLSNWNNAANLNGMGGSDKLVMSGNVNFTLSDTSLTRSTGGAVTLSSIEQAELIGGAGNNTINAAAFSGQLKIDGAAGNDTITGGTGSSLLLGGLGNDIMNSGTGRTVQIGGQGLDKLNGNTNDDLLIAGQTAHDANAAALAAILAEWASASSYLDRVSHLTTATTGLNGSARLDGSNVTHDNAVDVLLGMAGEDLFFAKQVNTTGSPKDTYTDKSPGESIF